MALSIWTGANSEDINAAGNWNGGVPGNSDTVIVPAEASRGMQTNMDQLADTITSWYIHKGFKFNIGATGNALDVSVTKFVDEGSGETWFKDGGGTTVDFHIRKSGGLVHLDGNLITNVRVMQGMVHLDSGLGNVSILQVGHNGNALNDATVVIAASGSTVTNLQQWGGTVISGSNLLTVTISAGVLEQTSDNLAINLLHMHGGTVRYNSTATLIAAYVYAGGVLDLMDDAQVKTVTDLWHFPGGRVIEDDGEIVTITNRHNLAAGFISPTGA